MRRRRHRKKLKALCFSVFLVRAPDSINGDGSAAAAAAGGAEILNSDNFEMTHGINLCYSLKFRK